VIYFQLFVGDGLPAQICEPCVRLVNTSYRFKVQCETTDTALRQYLSTHSLQVAARNLVNVISSSLYCKLMEILPRNMLTGTVGVWIFVVIKLNFRLDTIPSLANLEDHFYSTAFVSDLNKSEGEVSL
jgi:hypothetical protein